MDDDLIPLATLSWSPSTGWPAELIVTDDVGRECLARSVAQDLFAEHRAQQEAAARHRQEIERRAIEADQRFRASLPSGIPAGTLPEDVSGGVGLAMMLSDPERRGLRRRSVLEDALAHAGTVYTPIGGEE